MLCFSLRGFIRAAFPVDLRTSACHIGVEGFPGSMAPGEVRLRSGPPLAPNSPFSGASLPGWERIELCSYAYTAPFITSMDQHGYHRRKASEDAQFRPGPARPRWSPCRAALVMQAPGGLPLAITPGSPFSV